MNIFKRLHSGLKRALYALVALSSAAMAQNQPEKTPSAQIPPEVQQRIDAGKKIEDDLGEASRVSGEARLYEAAKTEVARNDIDGAKSILVSTNPFQNNTAEWSLENGGRLTALAVQLSKGSRRNGIPAVIAHALAELNEAGNRAKSGGDARLQATIALQTGYIHERFRGDAAAAIASYRAAVAADPSNRAANEALVRLQASVANLKSRILSPR